MLIQILGSVFIFDLGAERLDEFSAWMHSLVPARAESADEPSLASYVANGAIDTITTLVSIASSAAAAAAALFGEVLNGLLSEEAWAVMAQVRVVVVLFLLFFTVVSFTYDWHGWLMEYIARLNREGRGETQ